MPLDTGRRYIYTSSTMVVLLKRPLGCMSSDMVDSEHKIDSCDYKFMIFH